MAAEPPPDLATPGATYGAYTIVRRLGVGGMAETFEAVRRGADGFTQRVCLKLALPFLREDPGFVTLFQREARLVANLRHGNIVGVLDYGTLAGTPYMALELVDGVDLLTLLTRRGPLSAGQTAAVAVELAKALDHAHHHVPSTDRVDGVGVVHRDISPSNVMLSEKGEVLLTDFGLAKIVTDASQRQSAVKGKVPYMSPEQLRNDPLDARSDLFSLGVVLYECLAGVRPFRGGNDPAIILEILRGEHVPLWQVAGDAPRGFCDAVDQLLEGDADRRPQSAAALLALLDEYAPSPQVQRDLGQVVAGLRQSSGGGAGPERERTATPASTSQSMGSGPTAFASPHGSASQGSGQLDGSSSGGRYAVLSILLLALIFAIILGAFVVFGSQIGQG